MLKFFLDKFRETPGPLKQARLVVGDVIEELFDLAKHYLHPEKSSGDCPDCFHDTAKTDHAPAQAVATQSNEPPPKASPRSSSVAKRSAAKSRAQRAVSLDISPKLARAVSLPSNQKRQEFKVLAILWDAHARGIKDLSAKSISEHGTKLGLIIRHENVRKVIRMQLGGFVESVQNRKAGTSIYHYRMTQAGYQHFEEKYLPNT